jgi:serine/threonine protein kinase
MMKTNVDTEQLEKNDQFIETVVELMEINKIKKIALNDIVLKKKIGEGGQAKVYKGLYNDENVAVKVLGDIDWKCLAHEIVVISNMKHECIPKFYGIIAEEKVLGIVLEFIDGKTLDEYSITELPEDITIKIAKSLCSVLIYMHSNKFIHRDLKPENVILDNKGNVYLIDFGIAKVCTSTSWTLTRAKGTLHYLAPECLQPDSVTESEQIISKITTKVDVWAYGCILSYIFSGVLPWLNKLPDNAPVIQKAIMSNIPFPIPSSIKNKTVVEIITKATILDFKERPTMSELKPLVDLL